MPKSCCDAPTRFEDPGAAIEGSGWRPGTSSDDVLEGEVPDGLPLVLAGADPLEQLAVSERSGSERRRPQGAAAERASKTALVLGCCNNSESAGKLSRKLSCMKAARNL